MAHAHTRGFPCPLLQPGRMSWPHGALLLLWLFSPSLRAGGGGVAVTSAAGGGSPPATSCPAACSCSNQASRVICTRRELAEVPASIPVNTRYLNLQENSIQVSPPRSLVGPGSRHKGRKPPPPSFPSHPGVPGVRTPASVSSPRPPLQCIAMQAACVSLGCLWCPTTQARVPWVSQERPFRLVLAGVDLPQNLPANLNASF